MFIDQGKCLVFALLVAGLTMGCGLSNPSETVDEGVADAGTDAEPGDGGPAGDTGADAGPTQDADADAELVDSGSVDANSDDADPADDASTDADATAGQPEVAFVEPAAGAVVDNPVRFRVAASGVDEVEIFADETYSLGPAFDPSVQDELLYRFAGTGFARSLHVVGRVGGVDVARADLTITVNPDSCAERFFVSEFDQRNTDSSGSVDLFAIREAGLEAIKDEVDALQACGAGVSLGGMLSLLLYEGGFRAGAFNTRCDENSYHNTTSGCDAVAEALYSYQFGLGAIHTSNFHPCRGGSYTQGMRQQFLDAADAAGYPVGDQLVTSHVSQRVAEFCPNATPSAIDHYILGAHDPFGIPKNDRGNALGSVGDFPFLDPAVSIQLTFSILSSGCANISDDRDAIARWGGGDSRYSQASFQDGILAHYGNFATANCD